MLMTAPDSSDVRVERLEMALETKERELRDAKRLLAAERKLTRHLRERLARTELERIDYP